MDCGYLGKVQFFEVQYVQYNNGITNV